MPNYEDIVANVRVLLQGEILTDQVESAAAAYAGACGEVNQRLRRCGDFLARGLRSEAIHSAQIEPALLDAVGVLDFPERPLWEQFCAANRLPMPPSLDMETAAALDGAYADDQPLEELLRKHRLLALARAPLVNRLSMLRRIAELDTRNPAWETDIRTFEKARLQQLATSVDNVLRQDNGPALVELANELRGKWRVTPPASLVAKVDKAARHYSDHKVLAILKDLEVKLNDAMNSFDVQRAVRLRKEWQRAVGASKPAPRDPIWDRMATVLSWIDQQVQRQTSDASYQAAVADLEQALYQKKPGPELERQAGKLLALQRGMPDGLQERYDEAFYTEAVETLERAIDEGQPPKELDRLAGRFEMLRRPMPEHLERSYRQARRGHLVATFFRRLLLLSVFVVLLVVLGGGSWFAWVHMQKRSQAYRTEQAVSQLEHLVGSGNGAAARAYLEQLAATDPETAASPEVQSWRRKLAGAKD